MSDRVKPVAKTIVTAIPFNEAAAFIESITGRDLNDWEGKYRGDTVDESKKFHDFWGWIVEKFQIHNGCVISFHAEHREMCQGEYEWAREVLDIFLREFGDAKFWAAW